MDGAFRTNYVTSKLYNKTTSLDHLLLETRASVWKFNISKVAIQTCEAKAINFFQPK